ncbi:MAG: GNAT family N-acetyltransferase [Planctomycetota bacterium]
MTIPLSIGTGTMEAYERLAATHYMPKNPRAVERVYVATSPWFADPVGVLLVAYPVLRCALRDRATAGRYLGRPQQRSARLLNLEMRTIARVIVHPSCRGLGVASTMVRHAIARSSTVYMEARATMGGAHPFFQRAGMTPYPPMLGRHDARLHGLLNTLQLTDDIAVSDETRETWLHTLNRADANRLNNELRRWRDHRKGLREWDHPPIGALLVEALRGIWIQPTYFLVQCGVAPPDPSELEPHEQPLTNEARAA